MVFISQVCLKLITCLCVYSWRVRVNLRQFQVINGGVKAPCCLGTPGPLHTGAVFVLRLVLPLYTDLSAVSVPEKQQLLPTEGTSGNICIRMLKCIQKAALTNYLAEEDNGFLSLRDRNESCFCQSTAPSYRLRHWGQPPRHPDRLHKAWARAGNLFTRHPISKGFEFEK